MLLDIFINTRLRKKHIDVHILYYGNRFKFITKYFLTKFLIHCQKRRGSVIVGRLKTRTHLTVHSQEGRGVSVADCQSKITATSIR